MELLHNLATGFGVALTPANLFFALAGALIGTLIGVLPGIGPIATIAMLLPLTFHLEPTSGLIMAARESEEAFLRRGAVREIGLEHTLDKFRRLLGFDVAVDFRRDCRIGTESATDVDVISLDRITVLGGLNFTGQQPDIADVMLCA